jgi:hypothetical protein
VEEGPVVRETLVPQHPVHHWPRRTGLSRLEDMNAGRMYRGGARRRGGRRHRGAAWRRGRGAWFLDGERGVGRLETTLRDGGWMEGAMAHRPGRGKGTKWVSGSCGEGEATSSASGVGPKRICVFHSLLGLEFFYIIFYDFANEYITFTKVFKTNPTQL